MAKTDKRVFLALHLLLLFYSLSSVLSKLAAGQPFLSFQFCLCCLLVGSAEVSLWK